MLTSIPFGNVRTNFTHCNLPLTISSRRKCPFVPLLYTRRPLGWIVRNLNCTMDCRGLVVMDFKSKEINPSPSRATGVPNITLTIKTAKPIIIFIVAFRKHSVKKTKAGQIFVLNDNWYNLNIYNMNCRVNKRDVARPQCKIIEKKLLA